MKTAKEDLAGTILARIDHENELLAHRTTWVVASQAFLFSAYAVSLAGAIGGAGTKYGYALETLVTLLPWTALVSLVLLYVTIAGGLQAMRRLRVMVEPSEPVERRIVHGEVISRRAGLTAPLLIPAVFLFTWITLVVRR